MRDADKATEKGGSDEEMDGEEEVKKKKVAKEKGKGKATAKGKKGAKGKGGVMVPESWPWERAKELFLKPDVTPADEFDLEWKAPDIEGLVEFLVRDKGFKWVFPFQTLSPHFSFTNRNATRTWKLTTLFSWLYSEDRVRNAAAKLTKHLVAKQQGRLDGFFKAIPKVEDKSKGGKEKGAPAKRKVRCFIFFVLT